MKTLILTGSDSSMKELLALSNISKQQYASMHGYDFLSVHTFFEDKECGFNDYHIGFLRATKAFKMLRFYDNVMWLDADAVVTNFNYKIQDFIKQDESFIASYDWMHYSSFSTGNFIVRKTKDTERLFGTFLNFSKNWINNVMSEQGTLNQIYASFTEFKHMFNILPHKFLNSVPSFMIETKTWKDDNNRSGIVEPWNEESFLAHFTGASTSERIEIIQSNKLGLL